jgi:rod shape-determining protein MreD
MRIFLTITLSFLIALLLEILPFPNWAVWFKPGWVALVLIFWALALPYRIGMVVAFLMGVLVDLLMGTLMGEHAAAFVVITYFILRFNVRIRLLPLWQQSIVVFVSRRLPILVTRFDQRYYLALDVYHFE